MVSKSNLGCNMWEGFREDKDAGAFVIFPTNICTTAFHSTVPRCPESHYACVCCCYATII